ncbi:hypothetical protein GBAR_LOCUS9519, partial [Geodia barretti]
TQIRRDTRETPRSGRLSQFFHHGAYWCISQSVNERCDGKHNIPSQLVVVQGRLRVN